MKKILFISIILIFNIVGLSEGKGKNLLVIYSNRWDNDIQQYKFSKSLQGFTVTLKDVDDFNPKTAENIKSYIRNTWTGGSSDYILFLGDKDEIPAKQLKSLYITKTCYWYNGQIVCEEYNSPSADTLHTSDLYYLFSGDDIVITSNSWAYGAKYYGPRYLSMQCYTGQTDSTNYYARNTQVNSNYHVDRILGRIYGYQSDEDKILKKYLKYEYLPPNLNVKTYGQINGELMGPSFYKQIYVEFKNAGWTVDTQILC